MRLTDFDYFLPHELIAQYPLPERRQSRLLVVDGNQGETLDLGFADLVSRLRPGDLLVGNDTRVMKARFHGHKTTGGEVEILIERLLGPDLALAHLGCSKKPRPGARLWLNGAEALEVLGRRDELFELRVLGEDVYSLMERCGQIPLPPYIERSPTALDEERYQTVFSRVPGAVAAPTAGLHFDDDLLRDLERLGVRRAWVTLHVGAGTFQPVRGENLEAHRMHSEYMEVGETTCELIAETRARGGRVVAVGTTSVRSLETAAVSGRIRPFRGETRLFIRPGYPFRCVDLLITNFHLPRSTLLMLVTAFGGFDVVMAAYRHAVAGGYRFFSYGDAMLITRLEAGVGR